MIFAVGIRLRLLFRSSGIATSGMVVSAVVHKIYDVEADLNRTYNYQSRPRAVILGCSHAYGAEMEQDPRVGGPPNDHLPADSQVWYDFGWRHSYPVLVAEGLGYTAENYAISGGSNDAMFRLFTEQLRAADHPDLVIACWTGGNRAEIWHETENIWLGLTPSRTGFNRRRYDPGCDTTFDSDIPVTDHDLYAGYLRQWNMFNTGIELGRLNKIKNILAVNALAESHGIKIINIDSFSPVDNFKWPDTIVWPVDLSFVDYARSQGYPSTPSGHYFLDVHHGYAELMLAALNKS